LLDALEVPWALAGVLLMGRYPGSSTTLRPTPDGTKWDSGNPFDYSDGTERISRVPLSKAERKEFEEAQARDAGKLLRSFVSQCATAYADHKLSADYPIPPKSLRPIINAAAGNVSWLASDQSYRALFVTAYCRLCGEQIPHKKIWNDQGIRAESSGVSPATTQRVRIREKTRQKKRNASNLLRLKKRCRSF
jgi:hypothetical protein